MKILESLLVALLFLHGSVAFKVMCVYTNWSQYRPVGGTFVPEDVDPTLCTHLVYVYAKIKGNRLAPVEWNDDGTKWSDGMYQKVNKLKDMNPELKTLLGVGGWMMGGKDFSRLAAGRGSRRMFARTAVKFLRDRDFDGLTVDWQYPTKRGGRPKDKENYSLLLKEIRQAFDDDSKKSGLPPLLLTVGVSASREVIDNAYEVANVSKYVDLINVMAYDLHGPWDNYTGHPSQLYAREEEFGPSTEVNVDAIMRHWISLVPDRQKLIMGVSTYGRSFTLRKARHHEYNVRTTGPGNAGEFTQQPGMLAYYERCSLFLDAPRVWDPVSKVAYWYNGDQWTAGEDIESIRAKVNWMRHNSIGGIMLNSLDMDDFAGIHCTSEVYPLLHAIHHQITAPLPPDPRLFPVIKQPKPTPLPQPVVESTTFNWLESSSFYYDIIYLDFTTTAIPETIKPNALRTTTTVSFQSTPISPTIVPSSPAVISPAHSSHNKTSASVTELPNILQAQTKRNTRPTQTVTEMPIGVASTPKELSQVMRPKITGNAPEQKMENILETRNNRAWLRRKANRDKHIIHHNTPMTDKKPDKFLNQKKNSATVTLAASPSQTPHDLNNQSRSHRNQKDELIHFLKDAGSLPTHSLINNILKLLGKDKYERSGKDILSQSVSRKRKIKLNDMTHGIKRTNHIRDTILGRTG